MTTTPLDLLKEIISLLKLWWIWVIIALSMGIISGKLDKDTLSFLTEKTVKILNAVKGSS